MQQRRIGETGLKVSAISLGSWLATGEGKDSRLAADTVKTAYSLGVTAFDTANVYGLGEAERLLGETLRPYERSSYVLSTKAFWPVGPGANDRGLSRKHLTDQLHASLRRLQTDYIDLFYCHRYDAETPLYETLRTLEDFVRQGKFSMSVSASGLQNRLRPLRNWRINICGIASLSISPYITYSTAPLKRTLFRFRQNTALVRLFFHRCAAVC